MSKSIYKYTLTSKWKFKTFLEKNNVSSIHMINFNNLRDRMNRPERIPELYTSAFFIAWNCLALNWTERINRCPEFQGIKLRAWPFLTVRNSIVRLWTEHIYWSPESQGITLRAWPWRSVGSVHTTPTARRRYFAFKVHLLH